MATDITRIITTLTDFCDFTDKAVISVGAGGGQLVEYARGARKVYAVDNDPAAIERLNAALAKAGLADLFETITADFLATKLSGDVVVFEFCLHEMADPTAAIAHARTMAADVVVIDHAPNSEWSFYTAEGEKIAAEWRAVEAAGTRRHIHHQAIQRFADYAEIFEKLKVLGPPATERILCFRESRDFTIEMPYAIALLA